MYNLYVRTLTFYLITNDAFALTKSLLKASALTDSMLNDNELTNCAFTEYSFQHKITYVCATAQVHEYAPICDLHNGTLITYNTSP